MNIEPEKVVSDYERNLQKGRDVSCFGVLKLLNELLDEENVPEAKENVFLRDRIYAILSNGDKLFLGQNYSFDDRKPRDDLYNILQKEVSLNADRISLIRRALRTLPTTEKDSLIAKEKLNRFIEKLEKRIVKWRGIWTQ